VGCPAVYLRRLSALLRLCTIQRRWRANSAIGAVFLLQWLSGVIVQAFAGGAAARPDRRNALARTTRRVQRILPADTPRIPPLLQKLAPNTQIARLSRDVRPAFSRDTASSLNSLVKTRDLFKGISPSNRSCPSFFCLNPGVHSNTVTGIHWNSYVRSRRPRSAGPRGGPSCPFIRMIQEILSGVSYDGETALARPMNANNVAGKPINC
jgi:hypothetical protein